MSSSRPVLRSTGLVRPTSLQVSVVTTVALAVCAGAVQAQSQSQSQSQSGLWRSAVRAAGGPVDTGGLGSFAAEPARERTLRAGPALDDARVGWRLTWQDTGRYALWTGVGGAFRDTRQAFSLAGPRINDASAGLAPMVSAGGEWRIAPGWRLMAEFDGITGERGRTLDFDARVQWDLSRQWYVGAGWRVLDATFDSTRNAGYGRWSGAAFSAGWRF